MSEFWPGLWKRERDFLESGSHELLHETSFVGVATIAGQFYCEYKLENEFALGEIPTQAKEDGTSLHDELIPTTPIDDEDFVKMVNRKEPSYGVIPVWGKLADLSLIGTPDHIIWSNGRPIWLVELKTTRGDPAPLWDDQLSQTIIYGALLQKMGLDCSKLQLALVRLKAGDLTDEQRGGWLVKVSDALQEGQSEELESQNKGKMKIHLIKHDVAAAETIVRKMQGYWLGQREPTSSTSVGKCRACEYNSTCSRTLYKP